MFYWRDLSRDFSNALSWRTPLLLPSCCGWRLKLLWRDVSVPGSNSLPLSFRALMKNWHKISKFSGRTFFTGPCLFYGCALSFPYIKVRICLLCYISILIFVNKQENFIVILMVACISELVFIKHFKIWQTLVFFGGESSVCSYFLPAYARLHFWKTSQTGLLEYKYCEKLVLVLGVICTLLGAVE